MPGRRSEPQQRYGEAAGHEWPNSAAVSTGWERVVAIVKQYAELKEVGSSNYWHADKEKDRDRGRG